MPGGRPRLSAEEKAVRTSITLTRETHDRAVAARIPISPICEAALVKKLTGILTLQEFQDITTAELQHIEKELEAHLDENQIKRFAKVRRLINRLKGDAYIEK